MNKLRVALLLGLIVLALVAALLGLRHYRGQPAAAPGPVATAGPEIDYYTCSMHPFIHENKPGNCPVCGMKLQPVYKNTTATTRAGSDSMVMVSVEEERRLGLRLAVVTRRPLATTVTAYGRVEVNETNLRHIHTRYPGFVDRIFANTVGQIVTAGEPLLTIYSPELVATQEEYLLALEAADRLESSASPAAAANARSLAESAREKLRLLEYPESELARLAREKTVRRTITIYAPAGGYVVARNLTAGQAIDPAMDLYVLADLADPWVTADVYESDLAALTVGQPVEVTFAALANRVFRGSVSYVYPFLDQTTRTNKVRLQLTASSPLLKPGLFGEITIRVGAGRTALTVPRDAVMITGTNNLVFRQAMPGGYLPVPVTIGQTSEGFTEIVSGLTEGDTVVERANFYLDAESRLRATGGNAPSVHAGHGGTPAADQPAAVAPAPVVPSPAAGHAGH